MEDAFTFWQEHLPHEATGIARRHLGEALRKSTSDIFKGHHYRRILYAPDFNLAGVVCKLRKDLDEIGWLFLTTGERFRLCGEILPAFGIAPILSKMLTVAYHATRACLIPKICGESGEGLLPSNGKRRATLFPDTEGTIHVCEKLAHKGDGNDSAEWWMNTLSKKNNFNDPNWGIVRIDLSQLPPTARVYQDLHSASGVVVDRVATIPGNLISEVRMVRKEN